MKRQEAERLDSVVRRLLRGSVLEEGITRVQVCEAFDRVSGFSGYVLRKNFSAGILYCSMRSSMARELARPMKNAMIEKINSELGENLVKDIVFR